jgi:ketosteroid isomerase-like protein
VKLYEVLADVDVRAIQRLQRRWLDEELAGHSAAILDLCTEDVVWMPVFRKNSIRIKILEGLA